MRKLIDNDYLTMLFRLIVGGVFLYASYYKIIEPMSFAKSIWYYHMVPGSLINLIALILPWLELVTGIFVIVGIWYRGSVLWLNIMVIIFMIALISAIARNLSIDCGCFKASEGATDSAWQSLWFDVGLLVLTVQLWFSRSKAWMLQKPQ